MPFNNLNLIYGIKDLTSVKLVGTFTILQLFKVETACMIMTSSKEPTSSSVKCKLEEHSLAYICPLSIFIRGEISIK